MMTIPFLEVVLHTTENAFKRPRASLVVPESMVRVRSENEKEKEETTTKDRRQMSKLKGIKVPTADLRSRLHRDLLGRWSRSLLLRFSRP